MRYTTKTGRSIAAPTYLRCRKQRTAQPTQEGIIGGSLPWTNPNCLRPDKCLRAPPAPAKNAEIPAGSFANPFDLNSEAGTNVPKVQKGLAPTLDDFRTLTAQGALTVDR